MATDLPLFEEPSKDLTIGSIQITLCNELIQLINEELQLTFKSDAAIEDIRDAFLNNDQAITYDGQMYEGYRIIKEFGYTFDSKVQMIYKVLLAKEKEDEGITPDIQFAIAYTASNIDDSVAIEHKSLFNDWDDISVGTELTAGLRLNYNDGLWKVAKAHKKQLDWFPGADPTLFEQLDKDEHKGTLEDPIPVPDSVTTSGFTYIYGKYYSYGAKTYLCKRGGVPDPESMYGEEAKLTYAPPQLIGIYFEEVTE